MSTQEARIIFVIKISISTNFAGLDNNLFHLDKTMMSFGDAKKVVEDVTKAFLKSHRMNKKEPLIRLFF